MNSKNTQNQKAAAKVLHLNDFRGIENQPRIADPRAIQQRIEAVRAHIDQHLNNPEAPATAVAMAYIDAYGRLGIAAAGIEPEMASSLSHELRQLTATVERHQHARSRKTGRQRGYAALFALSALGFVAATYLNETAWVDAALSIIAQITAIHLAGRNKG